LAPRELTREKSIYTNPAGTAVNAISKLLLYDFRGIARKIASTITAVSINQDKVIHGGFQIKERAEKIGSNPIKRMRGGRSIWAALSR